MVRPEGFDSEYARENGITRQHLRRLGGFERLESLTPEAKALLLKPNVYGFSKGLRLGGLTKRGMKWAKDVRTRAA